VDDSDVDSTSSRSFANWRFRLVGVIEPERDPLGLVRMLEPQTRYAKAATTPLHHYGVGPFCRFSVSGLPASAGVYVVTLEDEPVYVGECQNLAQRWGLSGYGSIQPRNCYRGGQETNCRINNLIYDASTQSGNLLLWFTEIGERKAVENELKRKLRPRWNRG
jgi:hypothetical protein